MPDYSLVPVDHQPDFDDHSLVPVDFDPFIADDIIHQARTQQESQPQTGAGFDQPPSTPQTPGSAPPLPPIVPNDGQGPSVPQPPGQYPHSQYQALRPMLGDRNTMLATVYPQVRQTPIAQALAGQQQPGQTSEPAPTGHVRGVTQRAQAPTQLAQPEPQTQPQQPATGAGQPDAGAPAAGDGPRQGGNGLRPGGSDAGGRPNPTSDQVGASEPLPFSGFANPTPAESLVNRAKMADQRKIAEADPTGNNGFVIDGGDLYEFVTTRRSLARYPIDGGAGEVFTAIGPFYAYDGTRRATIDASPERPVTVTIKEDGTFTISRP
jgi:hypothetical protein